MIQPKITRFLALALGIAAVALQPAVNAQTPIVRAGYDLLVTVPTETEFMGQLWEGVPLAGFDFQDGNGVVGVGLTDTIIRRMADAAPGMGPIPMQIVALQLKSLNMFDPDGAAGPAPEAYYYITLNPNVGVGIGEVTILFDSSMGGPFANNFVVPWALRPGDLSAPPIKTDDEGLQMARGYWGRDKVTPTGGVPLIAGVNFQLNGSDTGDDFHLAFDPTAQDGEPGGHGGVPSGPHMGADDPWYVHLQQMGFDPAKHGVTECPEPSSWAFLSALALAGFVLSRRIRRS